MRETPIWRRYMRLLRSNIAVDVDEELAFHFARRVEDLIAQGLSDVEARDRAAREFGSVERVRRELQAIGHRRRQRERRAHWWESLTQDLRFAVRTLRKSPGFVAVVVATLALGMGGTTAVFSVVQTVLLAPLPYAEPGQLVRFYQGSSPAEPGGYLTGPHVKEVRDHAASFEDVAVLFTYDETGLDLVEGGQARRLRILRVSSDYFRALRSGPLRGRAFDRRDETGASHVVLSDALWRKRFGGDPAIIGATVHLSAEPYVVTGIAPKEFEDPIVGVVDAWLPLDLATANGPSNHFLSAIGRLRSGVSIEQAQAELAGLNRSMAERWPDTDGVALLPLKEDLVGRSRGPLQLLFIAVGLVLLVACVNVANLALVRATGRGRELAIRAALGSGGFRIARQLLVESVLLAALGGLLGLVLAVLGSNVLRVLGRDAISRLDEVGFDPVVLAFAALVTLTTGIAFGMAPAVRFARVHPGWALREQSRSATGTRGHARLRSALASTQLALALTLLVGAVVLMASFHRLRQVELGFRVERVLTFDVSLPAARYDAQRRAIFQEELARRIRTIPGVTAAGGTSRLPATGKYHHWGILIESGPLAGTEESEVNADQRIVSGDFFTALEIPTLAGRIFDARDDASAPSRAVVSAAFARKAFPGMPLERVVGQRIAPVREQREIIGVVGDVTLDPYGTANPVVYQAHRQYAGDRNWALSQVVATEVAPERILGLVRAEVAALDPQLAVHHVAPMTDVVGRGVSRERFAMVLMGAFAAVALMLAALGLYGVLAYTVRQRTPEIGIRMALGATAAHVRALVLRQAAAVVAIGLVAGTAGAIALGRALSALLFETNPSDPLVFIVTALLLTVVAFVAAWLPAWRASRTAPRIAMQDE
ncbi:MAG: FtsX-like permease family protein [Luteitalea sp.]|nr:FtsX-like permease family protein [Luteitalea sp.]